MILLVFGGAKLPKLAKSIGEAQHEFKKATTAHALEPEPSPEVTERTGPA